MVICSGVPLAIICPPSAPPSGPKSITQSEFLITSRFLFKGYLYSWDSFVNSRKQAIIYGAGNAGVQLVESLKKSAVYAPVAFIDDLKAKQGTILNYLEVFPFEKIETLIKEKNVSAEIKIW